MMKKGMRSPNDVGATPYDYMRGRHPHLFSDSSPAVITTLTREQLSYHLETITSQKQESDFEWFAHRICERFISPNLRPQTGPTGGGDGKTDAETYPVSADVALRWSTPEPDNASKRFAFAFSAKKDWRAKVKSDVKNIAGTNRKYEHIYFVTNQFVPARDSAAVQDDLLDTYLIPVTILDRTWLLEKVLNNDSVDIAVATLGIAPVACDESRVGPRDFQRRDELADLEAAIRAGSRYEGNPQLLAEATARAAILARGLERPAQEVNGMFDRAVRTARKFKLAKHELAATYDWAWSSFFWLQDAERTSELYSRVEHLALNSHEAEDLERVSNLLQVLRTAVTAGSLDPEGADLVARADRLALALKRLARDTSRPNNALYARALLLLCQIGERLFNDRSDLLADLWTEFYALVDEAEGLGSFPFVSIATSLTALGEFVTESKEFDLLYEKLADALVTRASEGQAAAANSERAKQKLKKGLPYEAIRWFGRATHLLVKEEFQVELIDALIGQSCAYEQAGLIWAARNSALAALSTDFGDFRRTGSVSTVSPLVINRYFWCEVRTGRLAQSLFAHELELMVRVGTASSDTNLQRVAEAQIENAKIVGALLLRTPPRDFKHACRLPDALDRLGLPMARAALLYLLGHEADLRGEGSIPDEETSEEVAKFFRSWKLQGDKIGLPSWPEYGTGAEVQLRSGVMGLEFTFAVKNELTSLGISEALLGAIEALLATSLSHRMTPLLDRITIHIEPSQDVSSLSPLEVRYAAGERVGRILHPVELEFASRGSIERFSSWVAETVLSIVLEVLVPHDHEAWTSVVLNQESAFARSVTFANVPLMLRNLYGEGRNLCLESFQAPEDRCYEVLSFDERAEYEATVLVDDELRFGEGDPPDGLWDAERMRHSDVRVLSPIDIKQWDAAKWRAAAFVCMPKFDRRFPPVFCLAFQNETPARTIFEGWLTRFGEEDVYDDLRVSIIRGISAKNPASYGVIVGPNLARAPDMRGGVLMFASRMQRMTPSDNKNLDMFLSSFARHGVFLLAPAALRGGGTQPQPIFELSLVKRHLSVRDAWEIGDNDPDSMILDEKDPPVIPRGKEDAPVIAALKRIAGRRSSTEEE